MFLRRKNKKVEKVKKPLKRGFIGKKYKKTYISVYYNYALCMMTRLPPVWRI